MAGKAQKKPLPLKEQSLFKELLALYESRSLKKAVKTADQILKKFPDHGETLCMKGLVLTNMNKMDEGMDLVKKGLVLDMSSHICWHVLGIIKKGEKNWDEALKAYTQAVRCDKENMNLLRDAAQLQVHLGLYDALQDTRWHILKLRPNLRQNWLGLAVACHLNGNLAQAKNILQRYFSTLKNIPDYDVEHSEVLLYYVHLLEELGELSEALGQLDVYAKERTIVDRIAISEHRARLLSKLSRSEDAAHAWRGLIDQNPDSYDYYRGYLNAKGIDMNNLTDETRVMALAIFTEFSVQLPRAAAPRRLALTISQGDNFRGLVRSYLLNGLLKGIPSLFVDVRALYIDEGKRQVIETIMEEYRTALEDGENISDDPLTPVDPTVYIWTLYFLALHYSTLPLSLQAPSPDPAQSLDLLQRAIDHTPTLPELFTARARVLKRAGNPFGAARAMEDARALDGQDRFLNWKSAKYLMRAGDIEHASQLLGLFTKKDAPSPGFDLEDMQCLVYMIEAGDAHFRNDQFGLALRRYKTVQLTFDEIENDQFDFHNYSMRRFTTNIYLNLLSFEKQLRSHPAYIAAALSSSKIYVRLYDDPSLATSSSFTMSDADKKAKKKAKKAARKAPEEPKKSAPSTNKDDDLPEQPKDEDPDGKKLLATSDPLGDAAKWLKPLETLAKDRVNVWIAIYDVAVRRKKFAQALKALNHARHLDSNNPELHVRLVDFHRRVHVVSLPPDTVTTSLVSSSIQQLIPPEQSLETFNNEYLQRQGSSAKGVFAAARVSHLLETPHQEVENLIFRVLAPELQTDIQNAVEALEFLKKIKSARTDEFRVAAKERFKMATVFSASEEIATLRSRMRITNEDAENKDAEVVP